MAKTQAEVKCLLLPVAGAPLLVPGSAVAEIITQQQITTRDHAPDWLLGVGAWRGREIPLISFERLRGEPLEMPEAAGRFVVLFGFGGESGRPEFYGIRIESLPRTETADRQRLTPVDGPQGGEPFLAARVTIGERECLIPDFDAVERSIAAVAVPA